MWKGQNIAVSLYKIIYFDTIQYDKNNLFTPFKHSNIGYGHHDFPWIRFWILTKRRTQRAPRKSVREAWIDIPYPEYYAVVCEEKSVRVWEKYVQFEETRGKYDFTMNFDWYHNLYHLGFHWLTWRNSLT